MRHGLSDQRIGRDDEDIDRYRFIARARLPLTCFAVCPQVRDDGSDMGSGRHWLACAISSPWPSKVIGVPVQLRCSSSPPSSVTCASEIHPPALVSGSPRRVAFSGVPSRINASNGAIIMSSSSSVSLSLLNDSEEEDFVLGCRDARIESTSLWTVNRGRHASVAPVDWLLAKWRTFGARASARRDETDSERYVSSWTLPKNKRWFIAGKGDGVVVFVGEDDGCLAAIDPRAGQPLLWSSGAAVPVVNRAASATTAYVALGCSTGPRVFDVAGGRYHSLAKSKLPCRSVAITRDLKLLAAYDNVVDVLSTSDGFHEPQFSHRQHSAPITAVADGGLSLAVSVSSSGEAHWWTPC